MLAALDVAAHLLEHFLNLGSRTCSRCLDGARMEMPAGS